MAYAQFDHQYEQVTPYDDSTDPCRQPRELQIFYADRGLNAMSKNHRKMQA